MNDKNEKKANEAMTEEITTVTIEEVDGKTDQEQDIKLDVVMMEQGEDTSLVRLLAIIQDTEARIMSHVFSCWVYPYFDKCFRWPIALLTLLTGTSMWSSSALTPQWFLALGCIQAIILFLMILQFYYDFDLKSQEHFQAALSFANLHRRLYHQWFKHVRRLKGLPAWGVPIRHQGMVNSLTSTEDIDNKWSRFFENIEMDFQDIPHLSLLPWIKSWVEQWCMYQGWSGTVLFHHLRSRLSTTMYSLKDVCSITSASREKLISFLIWARQQPHLNSQWTIRKMTRVDIECMNKQMLLTHILIDLNFDISLWYTWSNDEPSFSCTNSIFCINEDRLSNWIRSS